MFDIVQREVGFEVYGVVACYVCDFLVVVFCEDFGECGQCGFFSGAY